MTTVIKIFCVLALSALFGWALLTGIDREIARQEANTAAMCKHYGAAMNNWARQNNLTPPCAE